MVGKLTDNRFVSASEIPALLDLNPWLSKNELQAAKMDARAGVEPPAFVSEAADLGTLFEPLIGEEALRRLGVNGVMTVPKAKICSDKSINLQASLDGIIFGKGETILHNPDEGIHVMTESRMITLQGHGPLECKMTGASPEDEPAMHRGPLQLQAQMMCLPAYWGAIAVLYGGRGGHQMRIFLYEEHAEVQTLIKTSILDLEDRIENGSWSEVGSTADAILIHPKVEDEEMPPLLLPHEMLDIVVSITDAQAAIKSCQEIIETSSAALMDQLGNHSSGYIQSDDTRYHISWPMRNIKAKPEKVVAAVPASSVRQKTLKIKEEAIEPTGKDQ